ncbi:hypothetical protein [Hymenobacter sp. 102]|uniref:hypothetical protein n=1 Tax=Hymenobacter sp. 102 TaxID=3403152 RepID=UPI003CE902F4
MERVVVELDLYTHPSKAAQPHLYARVCVHESAGGFTRMRLESEYCLHEEVALHLFLLEQRYRVERLTLVKPGQQPWLAYYPELQAAYNRLSGWDQILGMKGRG